MAERVLREVVVPAAHGGAIEVRAGEYLAIIDLEGSQVADFVAIQRDDPRLFLCSPALYRQRFGLTDHRSCRMNLLEALAPYGIEESRLPDPINVFMRTPPRPDGEFDFQPAPSKAGDRILLRAFTDVVAAVSSCPMDLSPINGGRITPLKLVVAVSPDSG